MIDPNLPQSPAIPATVVPLNKTKTREYVLVILLVTLVCSMIAVGVLVARPGGDNTAIILMIGGFGSSVIAAIAAFLKSEDNNRAIQEVHLSLNSRLTEWMTEMKNSSDKQAVAAKAQGMAEGELKVNPPNPAEATTPTPSGGQLTSPGLEIEGTVSGTVTGTVAPSTLRDK